MMSNALIAGATGGIGLALAREYSKRGWNVALLGRDADQLKALSQSLHQQHPKQLFPSGACDFRDMVALPAAFDALKNALGNFDLVIYAAGVMKPDHQNETLDFAAEEEMFAVNTIGAVHVIGIAAEHMMRVGRGHLAAIGSIAGVRGRKGNPAYGASKAALHTYLEGMRNRLHSSGIRVSTIKPGFVNTPMLGGKHYPGAISPEAAARHIASALERHSENFFVPFWWTAVALAVRVCPSAIFKRFGPP